MTEQKAVRRSYRDLRQRLLHGIRWHAMAVQARKENSVLFATQGVWEKKLIMEEVEREGREGGRRGRRGGRKERGRRKKEEEEEEKEEGEKRRRRRRKTTTLSLYSSLAIPSFAQCCLLASLFVHRKRDRVHGRQQL